MVNEPNYFTQEPSWTFPSGKMEAGETPVGTTARELAEESGCVVDPASLVLIAVSDVWQRGTLMNRSWNYSAVTTTTAALSPSTREGEIVTDARCLEHADTIKVLDASTYPPKAVPVRRFLTTGKAPLHWAFDLIDSTTPTPTFRWGEPVALTSATGYLDEQ